MYTKLLWQNYSHLTFGDDLVKGELSLDISHKHCPVLGNLPACVCVVKINVLELSNQLLHLPLGLDACLHICGDIGLVL